MSPPSLLEEGKGHIKKAVRFATSCTLRYSQPRRLLASDTTFRTRTLGITLACYTFIGGSESAQSFRVETQLIQARCSFATRETYSPARTLRSPKLVYITSQALPSGGLGTVCVINYAGYLGRLRLRKDMHVFSYSVALRLRKN